MMSVRTHGGAVALRARTGAPTDAVLTDLLALITLQSEKRRDDHGGPGRSSLRPSRFRATSSTSGLEESRRVSYVAY